jgi:hypothetical protein
MQPNSASSMTAANTTGGSMEMYTATFGNMNFAISPA